MAFYGWWANAPFAWCTARPRCPRPAAGADAPQAWDSEQHLCAHRHVRATRRSRCMRALADAPPGRYFYFALVTIDRGGCPPAPSPRAAARPPAAGQAGGGWDTSSRTCKSSSSSSARRAPPSGSGASHPPALAPRPRPQPRPPARTNSSNWCRRAATWTPTAGARPLPAPPSPHPAPKPRRRQAIALHRRRVHLVLCALPFHAPRAHGRTSGREERRLKKCSRFIAAAFTFVLFLFMHAIGSIFMWPTPCWAGGRIQPPPPNPLYVGALGQLHSVDGHRGLLRR